MNEEYRKDFIENRKKMIDEMSDTDKEQMMKDFEMPSMQELMKMVNSMGGVSDEDREKIRDQLLKRAGYQNPGDIPAENVDAFPPPTAFEVISLIVYLILVLSFISAFGKISLC